MSAGSPIRTPPLRLLRAFYFAGKHSSFKAAAERLALTPSAVSHQVKELEEQLGVTLFQRRTRAITLTVTGRQLLEDLEPALRALQAAVVRASRPNARRQLHVVMPPFFASELFAPRLHDFHDRHPSIDIQVDTRDPRPDQHPVYSDVSVCCRTAIPKTTSKPCASFRCARRRLLARAGSRTGTASITNCCATTRSSCIAPGPTPGNAGPNGSVST
jgi:DNA-binding transcriptional LysR family regulator